MKKDASLTRILLHAFFLISLNLFSSILALLIVQVFGVNSSTLLQSGIAIFLNFIVYLLIFGLMKGIDAKIMRIDDFQMLAIILISSMALLPVIYLPMNYLIKGYWVGIDQLFEIWPYQLVVNGLCVIMNFFVLSKRK